MLLLDILTGELHSTSLTILIPGPINLRPQSQWPVTQTLDYFDSEFPLNSKYSQCLLARRKILLSSLTTAAQKQANSTNKTNQGRKSYWNLTYNRTWATPPAKKTWKSKYVIPVSFGAIFQQIMHSSWLLPNFSQIIQVKLKSTRAEHMNSKAEHSSVQQLKISKHLPNSLVHLISNSLDCSFKFFGSTHEYLKIKHFHYFLLT